MKSTDDGLPVPELRALLLDPATGAHPPFSCGKARGDVQPDVNPPPLLLRGDPNGNCAFTLGPSGQPLMDWMMRSLQSQQEVVGSATESAEAGDPVTVQCLELLSIQADVNSSLRAFDLHERSIANLEDFEPANTD